MNQLLGHIVCATRGGEGSEATVERAVSLARERGLALTFLYIVDVEFMKQAITARTSLATEELSKMGEFVMMTLVERAAEEGVAADYAIREGRFHDVLFAYLEEVGASTLVLGSPRATTSRLKLDRLSGLAREMTEKLGVEVELV